MIAALLLAAALTVASGETPQAPERSGAMPTSPKCTAPPIPGEDRVEHPRWTRRPTGEDMARAYPVRESRIGVSGCALMDCAVAPTGRLRDCRILDERPPGWGFARTTLQLAKFFTMATRDKDGRRVAGRRVRIPIRFLVPNG